MEQEALLQKRIQELAQIADRKGLVTFTDFLNLNEQNILHQTLQKFSWIHGETFGGYEGAERCMAAFIPDVLYDPDWSYPIACVKITPRSVRFAEQLSHRDILGALMNLGIERDRTGDIAVCDTQAFLFCTKTLAEMICRELTRIRHTSVSCELCAPEAFTYEPKTERIRGSVASVRLDAVMALAFHGSRSMLVSLIEDGKVFINGKLITTNAYSLKDGDLVSVRGMGKFRYNEVLGQTKKGRCMIEIEKYI
jgi:RNA-binding protein YlmH